MRNLISSFVGVNQCFLCDILCSLRYLTNGKLLFAILVPDSLIIYNNIICLPSLYHPLVLPFHTLSTWIGDHDPTCRQCSPSVPLLCHALLCMYEDITGEHVIYIILYHIVGNFEWCKFRIFHMKPRDMKIKIYSRNFNNR